LLDVTYQLYFGGGRNSPNTASQGIDSAPLPTDGNLQLRATNTNGGPGDISGYCMFPYKGQNEYAQIGKYNRLKMFFFLGNETFLYVTDLN
jgi:hypothetical protein